ncbi:ABC transporter permease [Gephyromycinifex aptenodytis]|uniref:ABC transporter permease n=1 Tax=Gephyromycinifex aptenodytis TaxID=2716227 RepID=UPI001D02E1CC|nr:ABC transporter permease [Gephyromycinifex aptenodytis]
MIVLTVALGASVATSMLSVMFDIGDKVNKELKAYGANIVVRPKGAAVVQDLYHFQGSKEQQSYLKEDELKKIKTIFWTYNITDFAPLLNTEAELNAAGAGPEKTRIVGTWFKHELNLPAQDTVVTGLANLRGWWTLQGDWPKDADPKGAVVGQGVADKQKLKVGDTFTVGSDKHRQELAVKGIVSTGGEEDNQVFTQIGVAQNLIDRPGAVGQIEVSALTTPDNELARKAAKNPNSLSISERETWYCTAYVSSIAYQIEETISDAVARPVRQVSESEGAILEKTQLLMVLTTLLSMAGSALAIANLVTANVMERARESGLLKAVGGRDVSVAGLILTEIVIIGCVGGLIGYVAGIGLAQLIGYMVFGSGISVVPAVAGIVAALVIVVVLLGSIPAIRFLLRLRPAEVLHGR